MGNDYPIEQAYVPFVLPRLAPAWMDAALRAQGTVPPRQPGAARFRYIDLGCGYGTTLLCLAAAYPEASFVGVDANALHVETARAIAADAGLSNVEFVRARFGAPELQDIAPAQYVITHGVYTWIAAVAQEALLADIARLVAPGGVVSIGASSFAGWARDLPARRVMKGHAGSAAPSERLHTAVEAQTKARIAGKRGALGRGDTEAFEEHILSNADIAEHDVFSDAWAPIWTSDLAERLSAQGLRYAGLQDMRFWRADYAFSNTQRAALENAPSAEARLTLQDCFLDYKYTCHLFAEDTAFCAHTVARGEEHVALICPPEAITYTARVPAGRLDFDNDVARSIVQHLAQSPARIADLVAAVEPSSEAALLRSIDALYASQQIVPVDPPHCDAKTAALNSVFEAAGAAQSAAASPWGTPQRADLVLGKGILR